MRSPPDQGANVGLVIRTDQVHHLAVERDGKTKDRREARHLQSVLHVADVGLRHMSFERELILRHSAFLPNLPQPLSEQHTFGL